jgi:hypothetical protein
MPFGGATFRAPAQLGWGNAMRFLLTAEEFGAAEALRIGLVQEVMPAGAHVQRAADLTHPIAQQAPLGIQATLASARAGLGRGPVAARTRRATVSHRCCRASCAARTPLKGCAASLNGARHVSPATDRFRRAACCAPCGHIRQAGAGCWWWYPEQDDLCLMSNRRPSAERCK